ncbi:MAG: hypothetical protein ACK5MD_09625 [Flavobacteriales bacterium]
MKTARKLLTGLSLLSLLGLSISCGEDAYDPNAFVEQSVIGLLYGEDWTYVDILDNGQSVMQDCEKDNSYEFTTHNQVNFARIYKIHAGTKLCTGETVNNLIDSGNYEVNESSKTVVLTSAMGKPTVVFYNVKRFQTENGSGMDHNSNIQVRKMPIPIFYFNKTVRTRKEKNRDVLYI